MRKLSSWINLQLSHVDKSFQKVVLQRGEFQYILSLGIVLRWSFSESGLITRGTLHISESIFGRAQRKCGLITRDDCILIHIFLKSSFQCDISSFSFYKFKIYNLKISNLPLLYSLGFRFGLPAFKLNMIQRFEVYLNTKTKQIPNLQFYFCR